MRQLIKEVRIGQVCLHTLEVEGMPEAELLGAHVHLLTAYIDPITGQAVGVERICDILPPPGGPVFYSELAEGRTYICPN